MVVVAVASASFFLFCRMRSQMPRTIRAMAPIPPTTPPTMGPIGVEEDSGCGSGTTVDERGVGFVERVAVLVAISVAMAHESDDAILDDDEVGVK